MNQIKELWYGNIDPMIDADFNTDEVKELTKVMAKQSMELNNTLTELQREMLDSLMDSRSAQEALLEANAFEFGFKAWRMVDARHLRTITCTAGYKKMACRVSFTSRYHRHHEEASGTQNRPRDRRYGRRNQCEDRYR